MAKTKDEIFALDDTPIEKIDIPEWGGEYGIRVMSGLERDHFEQAVLNSRSANGNQNILNLKARCLCQVLVNPDTGEHIFTLSDVEKVQKKSGAVIDRIWQQAQRVNHLLPEDVEALAKN